LSRSHDPPRVSDVVGFSRLAAADEERTLARLRTLRSDLIDPTISVHQRESPCFCPIDREICRPEA